MNTPDWIVLVLTLTLIILYGLYKGRTARSLDGYFLDSRSMPWWLVLLSIMGTQASAITFISAPGQAYTDGMRFVQYYFGIPLAMVVVCMTFVPFFSRTKAFTAYEFLEKRFDGKTRTFISFLFLFQRGLSTGISIFAPSIILSTLLGWNIYWTNVFMGGLLIIYTVTGGAKAVAYTQQLQFLIIFLAIFITGYYIVHSLPPGIGLTDALQISGRLGKFNVVTTGVSRGAFDWGDKYNIISGVIGGFFLALSYFGTDQSQVGRYLTGKSIRASRMGLLINGFVKVPMQFFILLIGILVLVFYQFNSAPAFFNQAELVKLEHSVYRDSLQRIDRELQGVNDKKAVLMTGYAATRNSSSLDSLRILANQTDSLRAHVKSMIKKTGGENNDTNYIFLRFVVDHLPVGLVGLLIAVIFLASWGSIAAALNSLASTTMIDFHKRFIRKTDDPEKDYKTAKWYTFAWGLFSVLVALFTNDLGNSLIEDVNILGSLFYGTILGIFLVAFYGKKIGANAVFIAAIITELGIMVLFRLTQVGRISLSFLWLNAIGALAVYFLAALLQFFFSRREPNKG